MNLQKGSDIGNDGRESPLEKVRNLRAAHKVDAERIEAMIASGETLSAIVAESGVGRHAIVVVLERWLRRNPRLEILRVHVSAAESAEIEEALQCCSSIKKTATALGCRFGEDQIRIVRGYLIGSQTE